MSETNNKLQKKNIESIKEKTQYGLAFGAIALMLYAVQFPMFVIIFFGIFAYFLWKTFTSASPRDTREVFEFYLSANEILRDDERRWFGFEIHDVIKRGEKILQTMQGAPPLVYFALGALYNKAGDYKAAVNHLSYIVENESSDESTYQYPSPELRNYTKILRKIEREPAEAPQTSAAIRALERARRNRAKNLLDESRIKMELAEEKKIESIAESKKINTRPVNIINAETQLLSTINEKAKQEFGESKEENLQPPKIAAPRSSVTEEPKEKKNGNSSKDQMNPEVLAHRKPISEVLHDLYGEK